MSVAARPLRVALDAAVASSRAEVVYVVTTLLEIAGYSAHFVWAPDAASANDIGDIDIYYGPRDTVAARLAIPSVPWALNTAPEREAIGVRASGELDLLLFPGERDAVASDNRLERDIVFASYWLLTGAREPMWPRSRRDDLRSDTSVLVKDALLARAPVSRYAMYIRRVFESLGRPALRWPWEAAAPGVAFSFTHDVDYPQIIRWIEVPRTLLHLKARQAWGVARRSQHFWKFQDWVKLARKYGARPTFYFMARQGSLLKFLRGTPDALYDVRDVAFRELFAELRDAGCEIGLHASYWSFRSAELIRLERDHLAAVAQVKVSGNRHHYWHLDPDDPNETLRRHELAGFDYDSSLGLEYYPGWRRGVCHPFRPYHAGERRFIDTVQVPPTWMDDHFLRRRQVNRIADPHVAARALLGTARALGGTCVVDYHARGMNTDFFPRYGRWLTYFAEREFGNDVHCLTGLELATAYRERERVLRSATSDETLGERLAVQTERVELSPLRAADVGAVAALHSELFGDAYFLGHSIATLGADFLARGFYALNLDNPHFGCDVARIDGRVIGFIAYTVKKEAVFAHLLRAHAVRLGVATLGALVRHPKLLGALWSNARYFGGERLTFLDDVPGWGIVVGVHPDARSRHFERRTGTRVGNALLDRMEERMRSAGCAAWYVAVRPDNPAINVLIERRGAREAGRQRAQGLMMRYLVKRFEDSNA
jgi:hypothetical protein